MKSSAGHAEVSTNDLFIGSNNERCSEVASSMLKRVTDSDHLHQQQHSQQHQQQQLHHQQTSHHHQIDSFVTKRIKATIEFHDESNEDANLPSNQENETDACNSLCTSGSNNSNLMFDHADLPGCWTPDSAKHFKRKYPWMCMKEGKLGCSVCSEIKDCKSTHSENWIQCAVVANGNTKLTQQSSLRKKLFEHSKTARHIQMVQIIEGECARTANWDEDLPATNGTSEDQVKELDVSSQEIVVTARVFLVVYNLCLQNRPMVDIEGQIQMLKAMQVNVGHCLHSRFTAIRIVDHIGNQMRRSMLQKVIAQEAKITVIVEEALMKMLQKPTFVLLFQCNLHLHSQPMLLFLDLFELQLPSSQELHTEIYNRLATNGFDTNYLWRNMHNPIYTLSSRTRDKYPDVLQTLPSACDQSVPACMEAISVSSHESDRLLSLLTSILTEERNRLNTEHIGNMMMIKSIGKPITDWDAIPYVKTWVKTHRNAMDTRIKNHVEKPPTEYSKHLWTLVD